MCGSSCFVNPVEFMVLTLIGVFPARRNGTDQGVCLSLLPFIGDVRCKGALMGVELVKDRKTKEPFAEASKFVYQHAFRNGLAWIPAGHILRMSPPLIMPLKVVDKAMDILEESIGEIERELT